MEFFYCLMGVQLLLMAYQSIKLKNLKKSFGQAQNKYISIIKKNDIRLHELYLSFEKLCKTRSKPPHLNNVPLADEEGMVLSVKKVEIPGIEAPYNAALWKEKSGYLLVFRFDTPLSGDVLHGSNIGCIHLRHDFEPGENSFSLIETGSRYSEDARIFQHEHKNYLLFNDSLSKVSKRRGMRMGSFDLSTKHLDSPICLEISSEPIEKNWTPFCYQQSLYFLYTLSPQKVIKLLDASKNQLEVVSSFPCSPQVLEWTRLWGSLRGGTPAQLVDKEYFAFFHSAFEDAKGIKWYVIGAYTFEAVPPFRLTRMSPYPILFEGIYETEIVHTAHPGIRSLYPVGFVCERQGESDVIHVSCGENDSAIKILTFDRDRLLATLVSCL